ncbi:hypothetical protein MMC16_001358 [Acarospora aff. strigata]|nr:hypothetical protein [Acarospora aff. strigata]
MSTPTPRTIAGVVVSAGKMLKTVKVRIATQVFDRHIRKFFPSSVTHLVHDPRSSLREGDIVRIAPGWRVSKTKRHVVTEIVAPFGPGVEGRERVLSVGELVEERERERGGKRERRAREREGRGKAEVEA